MNRIDRLFAAGMTVSALLASPTLAQAQSVGAAQSFAIIGGQSVTAAAGATQSLINGDVGVSPGTSITGFPANATTVPPYSTHANDGAAVNAQAATLALYNSLVALGPGTAIGDELSNQILGPGTYSIGAANIAANGNLTLSGAGLYIFKVASSLVANVGSRVTLIGVDPCQVYWQVTSAATLNGVNFAGNVVAQSAVTVGSSAAVAGRTLTTSAGSVTLAGSNVIGGCSTAPAVPPPAPAAADLIPVKSHSGNFTVGTNGTYTIAVSNIGGTATAGTYTINDTLPTGLTFVSASGTGWTCSATGQAVTCTNSTAIAAGASGPSISLVVTPGAAAVPAVTNTAIISGGGDSVTSNNTTADVTIVSPLAVPAPPAVTDLVITKSHPGAFIAGANGTYVIGVNNIGGAASAGTFTVVDTLPTGLTFISGTGTGWSCSGSGSTVTCTNTTPIAATSSAGNITLVVGIEPTTAASVTNVATIAGGGDTVLTNNSVSDVTAVSPPPVPTLTEWAMFALVGLLAIAGFVALSRRRNAGAV
ncbi:MAG: ice-binding family protein [Vicinamibacterales bacterium]